MLYVRYIDDSNQFASVPPKGAGYNSQENSKVADPEFDRNEDREEDERFADILKDIANSIIPCIQMEADWPSRNIDKRLPILDMKVWTYENGKLMFTRFEKSMANKSVINTKYAHTEAYKRSVNTQEALRRMLNCSRQLDCNGDMASVVAECMYIMKIS